MTSSKDVDLEPYIMASKTNTLDWEEARAEFFQENFFNNLPLRKLRLPFKDISASFTVIKLFLLAL